MYALRSLAMTAALVLGSVAQAQTELVMVERDGCPYCARWNAEIAPIYPKTPEGQRAPLRRLNIHAALPDDLSFDERFVFTPTFVLVEDGQEVARLEGYPGEDFFWGLLGRMLDGLDAKKEQQTD